MTAAPSPKEAAIALGLFLATLASTLWVGGLLELSSRPPGAFEGSLFAVLRHGAAYSLPLLAILLCHEMGHWLTAWRHRVRASLPYFLPMPFTLVGTLGAFIRIRSPFPDRRALLDVGLAGPFAGFVACLPFLAVGIATSRPGPRMEDALVFGEPLIFQLFAWLFAPAVGEGDALYLSPMGLAAWFGLLVTAINLLPMGQLDGGHALYAVFRGRARRISRLVHLAMLPLAWWSPSWLVWGLLCLLLGARRPHPPTLDDETPLPAGRLGMALAALAVFALCFTPEPVAFDWRDLPGFS